MRRKLIQAGFGCGRHVYLRPLFNDFCSTWHTTIETRHRLIFGPHKISTGRIELSAPVTSRLGSQKPTKNPRNVNILDPQLRVPPYFERPQFHVLFKPELGSVEAKRYAGREGSRCNGFRGREHELFQIHSGEMDMSEPQVTQKNHQQRETA